MNCPKCGKALPDKMNIKINFCPLCGDRLYEAGKRYLIQIQSNITRDDAENRMLVFVDDRDLYATKPLDTICFALNAGFHTLEFRHKIRRKHITLLVASNYVIGSNYNTLSGLIETNIMKVDETEDGMSDSDLAAIELTSPIMVSDDGVKSLDVLTGDDDPEYEFKVTSGLKRGVLKIYSRRLEFIDDKDFKKETLLYSNVASVRPKMGSIDLQCEGNVHKVYSIPKENYNEVIAFLTNRVGLEK